MNDIMVSEKQISFGENLGIEGIRRMTMKEAKEAISAKLEATEPPKVVASYKPDETNGKKQTIINRLSCLSSAATCSKGLERGSDAIISMAAQFEQWVLR